MPTRASTPNEPAQVGEPEADDPEEEDEDEDLPEEEYEVDKVIDHRPGPPGKYTYLVSWKGYGPEHNTWEPQDNLEHASSLVSEYWAKQPKPEAGIKKRARQPNSSQPAPRAAKAARKSTGATSNGRAVENGEQRDEPEEEEDDDALEFSRTHVDSIDKYADVKDWEELVQQVDTVERTSDGKLMVYVTMTGGERVGLPTNVAYVRCPQILLRFYEDHLKWRVGE